MSPKNKGLTAAICSILLACLSLVLFYGLCWTAAADAQGAIALFLYAPFLFMLVVGSFFLGRSAGRTVSFAKTSKTFAMILTAFYLLFYFAPVIGISSFSDKVIATVAMSFKLMTGKTPMEADKGP